jgi:hypothetical protein
VIPFADWVSTSHPDDELHDLVPLLRDVCDAAGLVEHPPGDARAMFRTSDGGLVRVATLRGVGVVSASGVALAALRRCGLFGDYLHVLGAGPHRVTKLHATLDVAVDAAPVVADLYARGHSGLIHLSRKAVLPFDISCHLSRRPDGMDSGTVYIGSTRAQCRAAVYDKQLERLVAGCADPGPLVRYEMRLSGRVGMTLLDAWDPTCIFFHVASPDILALPAYVPAWSPSEGGYVLPPRTLFTPAELMARKLDSSPDVARLLDLAAACGPYGFDLLVSRLRHMASSHGAALGRVARVEGSLDPVPAPGRLQ